MATTLLESPGLPSQSVYPLVNETRTVGEIVETLGQVLGRTIRYVPITDEQWADRMKARLNPHALNHLTHLWQSFRKGEAYYQATATVRLVTGRNPQSLEEFFRANAESFGVASH